MARSTKPNPIDWARRLQSAQALVKDMADATPGMRWEMRREVLETIGDVIAELVDAAAAQ